MQKHTNKNIDCPSKQTINSNLDRVIVVVSSNPKDKFTKKELWWLKTELTREFSSSGKFSVSSSLHNSKQKITNSEIFFLKQELEIIKTGLYFLNGNYFPNFINTTNDYLQSKNKDKEYLENDSIKVFPKIGKTTKVIVSSGKFIFNKRTHKIKACIGTTFQGQVISTFNNLKRFSLMLKKFKKNFFGDFDQRKGTFNLKVIKEIEASPSTIGFFIAARNVNGWICWQDENDKLIDSYR